MPRVPSNKTSEEKRQSHLRRNQACHQCRRKKLKCDAGRPCGTCMKSHAHIIAPLAVRGEAFDPRPNCTYDDPIDDPVVARKQVRSSFSGNLTSRPAERTVVSSADQEGNESLDSNETTGNAFLHLEMNHGVPNSTLEEPEIDVNALIGLAISNISNSDSAGTSLFVPRHGNMYSFASSELSGSSSMETTNIPQLSPFLFSPSTSSPANSSDQSTPGDVGFTFDPIYNTLDASAASSTLITSTYPPDLPPRLLLDHLIDVFFSCIPFAPRLLHRASFLVAMSQVPTSPTFPSTALLHAICAVASHHSPVIDVNRVPDLNLRPGLELFMRTTDLEMEHGSTLGKSGTFAMEQAALARSKSEFDVRMGVKIYDVCRTSVALAWFYYTNAQWVDAWVVSSNAVRYAVPLGLNASSLFTPRNMPTIEVDVMLAPSTDLHEQEKRRNIFWLSYMVERHQHIATQWASSIAEHDIGQELPGRLVDLESGNIPPGPRQRLSDVDLFTNHPSHLTDAFTLHLKAIILVSRVSSFNSHMKLQRQSDINNNRLPPEAAFHPAPLFCDVSLVAVGKDQTHKPEASLYSLRETPAFKALDSAIIGFRLSIPKEFRDPFMRKDSFGSGGVRGSQTSSIDPHLYAAYILPSVAAIMLHDPHADLLNYNDRSRETVLQASRVILESIYELTATSFDFSLLPNYCISYWQVVARSLARFYRSSLERDMIDDAAAIKSELDVVSLVLGNLGEKLPVAFRAQKSLDEMVQDITRDVARRKRHAAQR